MSRLTLADFKLQFRNVIDPRDRLVVVYSGIWTFGHRFGMPISQIPQALIEAMLEELGPHQNLLLPSYTYAYAKVRRYSPQASAPETGVLPVAMLKIGKAIRSRNAFNSFLIVGPDAAELAEIRGETVWGEGGLKAYLQQQHARLVVLGLPWKDACGFLHRMEEACQVPYRYQKTFHGTWVDANGEEPWSETLFVRSIDLMPIFQWRIVDDLLRSRGLIQQGGGEIHIESADAAECINAGTELLMDDPYALIVNRDEVAGWVNSGKVSEIEALGRAEPRALDYIGRQTR